MTEQDLKDIYDYANDDNDLEDILDEVRQAS